MTKQSQETTRVTRQYYVYMMTNKSNTVLYTGVTNDLKKRAYEHKEKRVNQQDEQRIARFAGRIMRDCFATFSLRSRSKLAMTQKCVM